MVGVDPSPILSFRGKPYVDARTGDIIFIAYRGLRFIPCRAKRGALTASYKDQIDAQICSAIKFDGIHGVALGGLRHEERP